MLTTEVANAVGVRIGRAIRNRRRLLELTQRELGARCGLSFQRVQKFEAGITTVSAPQIWALACALGVPVTYFFDGISKAELSRSWSPRGA